MKMFDCPVTGAKVSGDFLDEKQSLKKSIELLVNKAIGDLSHVREDYFLTIHSKFDNQGLFCMDNPTASTKIPSFTSNQMVFWISNTRGISELLWMVAPCQKGQKLKVEFNKTGVAYLQAKGAMSS
jgi:hypothetical protein